MSKLGRVPRRPFPWVGSNQLWLPRPHQDAYLLEGHHGSRLLHHGVLLVALNQVAEGVEALPASHVVLPVWLWDDSEVSGRCCLR